MHTTTAVLDRTKPVSGPAPTTSGPRYRVLVADDERDVIHALRLLFGDAEIATLGAVTPADAVSITRAHPLDAALVDLNYGTGRTNGEQGLQLIATLHAEAPLLPIIAMTGWNNLGLVAEVARRGASDVVEKPWDEHRLMTLIRTHAELGQARRRIAELEVEVSGLRGIEELRSDEAPATMRLRDVEGMLVRRALDQNRGNISRTARALGLSRAALYRRLERHGIS